MSGLALCALFPAGASAAECSIDLASTSDPGSALFDSQGYEWDVNLASAAGPDRNDAFATLDDGGSNGPAGNPPGPRLEGDSYDQWGALFVGGDALTNLYHSTDDDSCAREDGDRELVFPELTIDGLQVQRKLFVHAIGMPGARILSLITNPGAAPVTTSVQVGDTQSDDSDGDLGSDGATAVRSSSSGDAALTPADFWAVTSDHDSGGGALNTDLALAHVIDGPGGADKADFVTLTGTFPTDTNPEDNLAYRWDDVTIAPGQTAAYMSFEVQQGVAGADAATEDANAAAQADAYQTADPSAIYEGMSQGEIAALRNWSDLELLFSLDASPKQRLKKLAVRATCPEEACTVALSGKAKAKLPGGGGGAATAAKAKKFNVTASSTAVAAGQTTAIPVGFNKGRKLRKLLKDDAKAKLNLTAQATDAAASTASAAATIKLK